MRLVPFQRKFLKGAKGATTVVLSMPRGNGKSFLAAYLCAQVFPTLEPHEEIALAAASIEQGRIVFRFVRQMLGEDGYRYLDSATRCGITGPNGARLRVLGSNGKTSMGLVNTPWVIADEPGAWEVNGGQLMADAILTAQGKPGSPLRAVFIGTLAPSMSGWWHDLVMGEPQPDRYLHALIGDRAKWDDWKEICRVNPLTKISPEFREKLKLERAEARCDSRLKARFLSYRLNVPTADEATTLLTVDDWQQAIDRDVAPRKGRPIVAVDLGAGRAWSAAVAIWETGRCEAMAVAPGIPSIVDQEKRDGVPAGLYRKLVQSGRLDVANGLRVPPVGVLVDRLVADWGRPKVILCDRFRMDDLQDALPPCPISPRVTRWSEAAADIRDLRKLVLDEGLSVEPVSRDLLTASLAVATVKNDDQGNVRLIKRGGHNKARDDVAAALVLAAGAFMRWKQTRPTKPLRFALAG